MTESNALILQESHTVLTTHARSFRWAAMFLAPQEHDDAAVVYAFCRLVDDTADEADDARHARAELNRIRAELDGSTRARPLVRAFVDVAGRLGMDLRYADELIEGVLSDLGCVSFEDDAELLRYCYRVAGTVGLMMCSVLGVDDPKALPHAIDLGVAMQLTNICRDVLEDAQMGRVYLPEERLAKEGIGLEAVLDETADPDAIGRVVGDLLKLAENYYRSADYGMRFIPARSRLAIVVAGRLYRAIGLKIMRGRVNPITDGRTWVAGPEKLVWSIVSLVVFLGPRIQGFTRNPGHDPSLHRSLRGLPGVAHDARRLESAA